MRVNVESFLALVVLLGGGAAVTAAVVTANDGDDAAPIVSGATDDSASIDDELAARPADPIIPLMAKPAPVAPKLDENGEPVGTFVSTILEPIPDEDPDAIPGPDVEGF